MLTLAFLPAMYSIWCLLYSMQRDRLKRGVVILLCTRGGQGIALALEAL